MQPQCAAGHFAAAGYHIENALGNAGFERQLGQAQRGQRRLLGRLEHHRISHRQGRAQFPGGHDHREVPRHHQPDHADRLFHDQRQIVGAGRADLAIHLVAGLAVILDAVAGGADVDGQRVRDRLAHRDGFQQRQLFLVGAHQLGEFQQNAFTLPRLAAGPAPILEGGAGGLDGLVDDAGVALGDFGGGFAGRGIDQRRRSEAGALIGAAADQGRPFCAQAAGAVMPFGGGNHAGSLL